MKKLPAGLIIYVYMICVCPSAFSMEWPVTNGIIEKNFGWNDGGQPVLGIVYRTEEPISAAEQGELLFEGGGSASRMPSPLGTWTAIDHGGGIIGVYSRMRSTPEPAESERERSIINIVERSTIIGEPGTTGWSGSRGLYFSLYDRREKRWINPVMIISPLPDTRAPTILSVKLRNQEGRLFELANGSVIPQGRYSILVDASQVIRDRPPLAPFRINCSVNGVETGRLNFETYSARDGTLLVYRNGLVPVREIYSMYPSYELGTAVFTRGQVTMEVITQDAANNLRSQLLRFTAE